MRSGLKHRAGGWLARGVIGALMRTVRFTVERSSAYAALEARGEPVVYACWHGRLLPLSYYHRGRGFATLISRSGDGEYIARVVEGWGYVAARGSTSRGGGEALRSLVQLAREGRSLAITPDGPRGPRQRAQPGAILAARLTGHALVPVAAGCTRAWWPGGWDRFCVPKPFSRVRIVFGEPRYVPRDAEGEELTRHIRELEMDLNEMTGEVDRGGGPDR